ncbi:MAG: hypothetical protein FWF80_07345 [Defluviitaleaceae bacterium]|nr:hypothetical protein [Defluviitaleaceae bacterium]
MKSPQFLRFWMKLTQKNLSSQILKILPAVFVRIGASKINLGGNVEASPAVFGNMLAVGTRGQRIFGIEIM